MSLRMDPFARSLSKGDRPTDHHQASALRVGDLLSDPAHGGQLAGAPALGEVRVAERLVRVGLWRVGGRVVRARFQATVCAPLVAYAEAACRALEAGVTDLPAAALHARVRGVHPVHLDRAELVAAAVRAALSPDGEEPQP